MDEAMKNIANWKLYGNRDEYVTNTNAVIRAIHLKITVSTNECQ